MRKVISTTQSIGYFGISLPILIGAGGLSSMLLIAWLLRNGTFPLLAISQHKVVNFTFTMQLMVLPISLAAVMVMYLYNKESFKIFFRLKTSSHQQTDWKFFGPLLAIAFTLGTTLYMSMGVAAQNGAVNESFFKIIPWVLLFAATNSWSEEIFSRFAIVAGLYGKMKPVAICWISAVLFGLPHLFGTPNGIFGVIMSGWLGWLLAKSVIETKGLGWALFIHFLQDVVIFGGGAMIVAGQP